MFLSFPQMPQSSNLDQYGWFRFFVNVPDLSSSNFGKIGRGTSGRCNFDRQINVCKIRGQPGVCEENKEKTKTKWASCGNKEKMNKGRGRAFGEIKKPYTDI